jgi:hypothetical protein
MNFREQLHKARFGPICNIGGSDSDSQSSSTTNNIDQRLNADNGATGVSTSGTGNSVTVQAVDHGAVSDAFGLGSQALSAVVNEGTAALSASSATASQAINGMLASTANSLNFGDDVYTKAINAVTTASANSTNAVQDMASRLDNEFSASSAALASAYQDAKTGDQKTLMLGAFAVAAIALFAMAHRKG